MKINFKHYFILIVLVSLVSLLIFFINKGSLSKEESDKIDEGYFLNLIWEAEENYKVETIYK